MRMFSNVKEAMIEIEREIHEMGLSNHPNTMQDKKVKDDDGFNTKELIGYSYCLTSWPDKDDVFNLFNNDLKETGLDYCDMEIQERVSFPTNPGSSWKTRPQLWNRFLEKDA